MRAAQTCSFIEHGCISLNATELPIVFFFSSTVSVTDVILAALGIG